MAHLLAEVPASVEKPATQHQQAVESFALAAAEVAGQMWTQVDPDRIFESWAQQVPELTAVVSGAQLGAARMADGYTDEALAGQDLDTASDGAVNPPGFAGHASDGSGLIGLLTNPAVVTLLTIADAVDVSRALGVGRARLDTIVRTQVTDAGRLADQASLVAHQSATGYVRVTDGNPCARCLLLAGKTYRWNQGFQRHPRCACTHVPTLIAHPRWRSLDPRSLYDEMTPRQRLDAGFTLSDQRALAMGGDLNQIVNARHRPGALFTAGGTRLTREGTTRRGFFGGFDIGPDGALRRRPPGPIPARLTTDEIYRIARSREEAIALLTQNRYLIPEMPRAVPRSTVSSSLVLPRPVLASARTTDEVADVLAAEYLRITGRPLRVRLAGSTATARDHAEGILRGAERFPNAPLESVTMGATQGFYGLSNRSQIIFSDDWAAVNARRDYLAAVQADMRTGWHPKGTNTPASVAMHEFAHSIPFDRAAMSRLIGDRARTISAYAARDLDEAVAEAVVDVLVNGERAALLSRQVVDLLDRGALPLSARQAQMAADFAARRVRIAEEFTERRAQMQARAAAREELRQVRAAERAALRQLRAEESAARRALRDRQVAERREAVRFLPSSQNPATMTLTQLRARVTAHNTTVPAGLRTPALRQLVADLDSGMPAAAARARAAATIVGERRAVAEALSEAAELVANGASPRALAAVAARLRSTLGPDAGKVARPLLDAMDAGDAARINAAVPVVARAAKLRQVGGTVGQVSRLDRSVMQAVGAEADAVRTVRPGWATTFERQNIVLNRAAVVRSDIPVPAKAVAKKAAPPARPASGDGALRASTLPRVTDDQADAIRGYGHGEYRTINRTLRAGRLQDADYFTQRSVRLIDEAFADAATTRPITVGRSIPDYREVFPDGDLSVGRIWVDPAYVSTNVTPFERLGEAFGAGPRPMRMTIVAPKGTRAISQGPGSRRNLLDPDEVLLDRGLTYRIVADNGVGANGFRLIDVEVVPRVPVPAKAVAKKAPAKAAKKAPAPKPLPDPDRMSLAAVNTELDRLGVLDEFTVAGRTTRLDLAGVPKPVQAQWLRRARAGDAVPDQWRQIIIDRRRVLAETLAEADELLDNLAVRALDARQVEVITKRLQGRLTRAGAQFADWPEAAAIKALLAAIKPGATPAQIRRAMAAAARKHKLTRLGDDAGTLTRYDRTAMTPLGDTIPDGAQVVVVRPGYAMPDGTVISRPVVQPATGADIGIPSRDVPTLRDVADGAQVKQAVDGTYAGLRVDTSFADVTATRVDIAGEIYDAKGNQVGEFSRYITRENGQLVAHHEVLTLRPNVQGSGFAQEFNENLYDWYRRSGVTEVRMLANIDVGGYSWARKGFDFADTAAASEFIDDAMEKIDRALGRIAQGGVAPRGITAQQLRELRDYIAPMQSGTRAAHAPDIAEFGRQQGQAGKRAMWPGKWLMLGSEWQGVMIL